MQANESRTEQSLLTSLSKTIGLLPRGSRGKLQGFVLLQFIVSILDAIGILLMGLVASLTFAILSNLPTPTIIENLLVFINAPKVSNSSLLFFAGITAAGFLVIRTIASLFISKKIYLSLAHINGLVSSQLVNSLLKAPFSWIRKQNAIELSYAMNQGLQLTLIGITGQFIIMVSEVFFLLLILSVLATVNLLMTLVSILLFTFFGLFVYFASSKKISTLANLSTEKLIEGNQQVINSLGLFREYALRSSKPLMIEQYSMNRIESAIAFARLSWIQLIPKFSIEITIIIGAFLLTAISIATSNFNDAVSNLTVFLAATSRIGPSALRLQQSASTVLTLAGQAHVCFKYYDYLLRVDSNLEASRVPSLEVQLNEKFDNGIPTINFDQVSFNFEDSTEKVLSDITFKVQPGEIVAVVGPSGSGKSTLFDLLLGLLSPTSGSIRIGGVLPKKFIQQNPGTVSYLPQDPFIIPASLEDNITLGSNFIFEDSLTSALKDSNLLDFVQTLGGNINTLIGEGGNNLSGGQRQRVALARALYLRPKVILLDEPTSALDSDSENQVMEAIQLFRNKSTVFVIAHRLSTLRFVDKVIYIQKGRLVAIGALDEVRNKVPNFDSQIKMLGF
jgi:ABC-type multidrug transport system fused ATPase/permease subunit